MTDRVLALSKSWRDIAAIGTILAVSVWLAGQGWTRAIGGGELLNVQSGLIASTPQDAGSNAFLGYLTHLHLFRHAIFTPRPFYQTIFIDLFGTSASPFHAVALLYSFGTAAFLYVLARQIGLRWLISAWVAGSLLVSSALAMRWYGVEAGTTHNAVAFFMMGSLVAYERYRSGGKRWGVVTLTGLTLAAVSYPSGFLVPLLPALREIAQALTRGFDGPARRELRSRLRLPAAALAIGAASLLFNSLTTGTFGQAGAGGAILGTRYGEGLLTGLSAWAGSFWTPLPSPVLEGAKQALQTVGFGGLSHTAVIITVSVLLVVLLGAIGSWLAKTSLEFRQRTWTLMVALVFGLAVWMVLASTYLYALTDDSPNGAGDLLSKFLLSWGAPLEDTGNPYYLLTAPIVLMAAGTVVDGLLDRVSIGFGSTGSLVAKALVAVALGLLLVGNAQSTVGLINRPVVKANSGRPFVDAIKKAHPEFPRGSTLVFYDQLGVPVDLWLWLEYGDSRRPDRTAEYQSLDLYQVLTDNVSWYSERFVGRQMSPDILELYTNIRRVEYVFLGPEDGEVDVDALPVDELSESFAAAGRIEVDRLFAFVIHDFNRVTEVTGQIRSRINEHRSDLQPIIFVDTADLDDSVRTVVPGLSLRYGDATTWGRFEDLTPGETWRWFTLNNGDHYLVTNESEAPALAELSLKVLSYARQRSFFVYLNSELLSVTEVLPNTPTTVRIPEIQIDPGVSVVSFYTPYPSDQRGDQNVAFAIRDAPSLSRAIYSWHPAVPAGPYRLRVTFRPFGDRAWPVDRPATLVILVDGLPTSLPPDEGLVSRFGATVQLDGTSTITVPQLGQENYFLELIPVAARTTPPTVRQ